MKENSGTSEGVQLRPATRWRPPTPPKEREGQKGVTLKGVDEARRQEVLDRAADESERNRRYYDDKAWEDKADTWLILDRKAHV